MKSSALLFCCVASVLPMAAGAQESLVGTWNASYTSTGIQSTLQSVTVVITSVENGVITGTGTRHDRACGGEYPIVGSLKEDVIRVRAVKKGGPAGDCGFGFTGKVEGGKIIAKYGPHELTFTK